LRGAAGVVNLPGFNANEQVTLKVLTFTGQHECGCPTDLVITARGNVGQSLRNMAFTMDMIPPVMCKQCGKDLKDTQLFLDAQHGEDPKM
jgi:hypothetical protein